MVIITEGLCGLVVEEVVGCAVEDEAEFFDVGEVDFFYLIADELCGSVVGESVAAQEG